MFKILLLVSSATLISGQDLDFVGKKWYLVARAFEKMVQGGNLIMAEVDSFDQL